MKRYEVLAQEIAESIASGGFRPGDRLPSVRETSESRGVSPSTVFQAYYLLEARGLVQPRARSGYFVSHASATGVYPTRRHGWGGQFASWGRCPSALTGRTRSEDGA